MRYRLTILISVVFVLCLLFLPSILKGQVTGYSKEYFDFLKSESFSPSLDDEGDIAFNMYGKEYFLILYDQEPPIDVQIQSTGMDLSEGGYSDQQIVWLVVNQINVQKRVSKLVVVDGILYGKIELLIPNVLAFRYVFYRSMEYLNASLLEFDKEYKKLTNFNHINTPVSDSLNSQKFINN
jgi:hypothetical protein